MSTIKRNRFRKKLKKLLSKARDEEFIQLIWAVDALQTDRVPEAALRITYPPEAATSEIGARFAIHKWELETLVSQLLTIPKNFNSDGERIRITNCTQFATCSEATNFLRGLENEESAIYLKNRNVLDELPRIGHREFAWQRGFANRPQLYRYAYIYGQGECATYFRDTYGLTIDQFSMCGFGMYSSSLQHPLQKDFHMRAIGVADEIFAAALRLLSLPISKARNAAETLRLATNAKFSGGIAPTAYQPSLIRQFPILAFGDRCERLRAPLPDLILLRITSGLFYDLIKGGSHLRNEASERFEKYAALITERAFSAFGVLRSENYRVGGNQIATPDLRLKRNDKIVVAIECKATRLSFDAQFADDPFREARTSYDEIAKGIFQLWRYFSHARRGFVDSGEVDSSAHGIVLTLDSWLVMSPNMEKQVLAKANELADKDGQVTVDDRRKISFTSINDFELLVHRADEEQFLSVLSAARNEGRFHGYMLPDIFRDLGLTSAQKRYPFDMIDLPWWNEIERQREVASGSASPAVS